MSDSRSSSSGFYVLVTGQIDGVQMQGYDNLYVKYSFNKGHDWSVLAGVEHGVSQISQRSSGSTSDHLVWNYPLDIMFRSSNVYGWPQIVIGVYGLTMWGGDVIRGYGCAHVPTMPGRYTRYISLYTPISSSVCQRFTSWLTNNPPEFFDSKFIAQGKGREVTRVRSHGTVKVTFNVTTKNMNDWGYQVSSERVGDLLHAQSVLNSSAAAATAGAAGTNDIMSKAQMAALAAVPARTQLSASTAAGIAANRARNGNANGGAGINPPSASGSRENSLIKRNTSNNNNYDSSIDEMEQKYPSAFPSQAQPLQSQPSFASSSSSSSAALLAQRPSPTLRSNNIDAQNLAQRGRTQLNPL